MSGARRVCSSFSQRALEALGPPVGAPQELKDRLLHRVRLLRSAKHAAVAPGALLAGKYRLLYQLGAGAMGTVWAAVNESISREVAVKLLVRSELEFSCRLQREAWALGAVTHRNVIEVYDVDQTEDGDPFLVMQLLTGETVAALLARKRRLDPRMAMHIGRDVARALAATHALGIVHRDLKPANIFLHMEPDEQEPVVKVLDFGIAKNLAVADGLRTTVGDAVGSPLYMSPEQIRADRDVDHRADIWAFGVVMFEMLTGIRPFNNEVDDVFTSILSGDIPRVDRYVRRVDPGLVEVVERCLRRGREERFRSAAEVAEALDRIDGGGVPVQGARAVSPISSAHAPFAASWRGGEPPSFLSASDARPGVPRSNPLVSNPDVAWLIAGAKSLFPSMSASSRAGAACTVDAPYISPALEPAADPDGRISLPSGSGAYWSTLSLARSPGEQAASGAQRRADPDVSMNNGRHGLRFVVTLSAMMIALSIVGLTLPALRGVGEIVSAELEVVKAPTRTARAQRGAQGIERAVKAAVATTVSVVQARAGEPSIIEPAGRSEPAVPPVASSQPPPSKRGAPVSSCAGKTHYLLVECVKKLPKYVDTIGF